MANSAQASQSKSDNLGNGAAYAFIASRVNPTTISFKVWILGYYSKKCSIAIASLPELIAQIDTALADENYEVEIGGARFTADDAFLRRIRKEFLSYTDVSGVSDANNVRGAGSAPKAQPESPRRSAKTKASASVLVRKRQLSHSAERGGVSHTSLPRLSAPNAESSNLNNPPKNGGGRASNRAGKGSPAAPAAQRVFARGRRTSVAVNP